MCEDGRSEVVASPPLSENPLGSLFVPGQKGGGARDGPDAANALPGRSDARGHGSGLSTAQLSLGRPPHFFFFLLFYFFSSPCFSSSPPSSFSDQAKGPLCKKQRHRPSPRRRHGSADGRSPPPRRRRHPLPRRRRRRLPRLRCISLVQGRGLPGIDLALLSPEPPPASLTLPSPAAPPQQTGLAAILGGPSSHPPRGSPADIATHARIFYYARRVGVQIDFARYQSWLLRRPDHQPPRLLPDHPSPRGPEAALASASRQEPTTPSSPLQHPQQQEQQQQQQPPPPQWQQAAPKAHLYVERAPPSSPTPPRADAGPDYPAAFAEMLSLLQQGRPIPGIREIPATISRHPVCSQQAHTLLPSPLLPFCSSRLPT